MLERFKDIFAGLETAYGYSTMNGNVTEKGKKEATDGEGGCGKMMKDGNGGPGDNPMKGAYYKFLKKSRSAARIAKTVGLGL